MLFPFLNPLLQQQTPMLDSASGDAAKAIEASIDVNSSALNSEIQALRKAVLASALMLAHAVISNELDDDELPSDRLDSIIAGLAHGDDDEEFEADEATVDIVIANMQDAFSTLGVDDGVIQTMFGGDADADEAIEAAAEIIESNAPTGDDVDELIDLFAYGEAEDDEMMLDGVSVGKTTTKSGKFGKVVYKAVKAIRNGKVAIVNKRVSGKVKMSAKQRAALNKARRKANSSVSIKKRIRSLMKSKKMGI